MCVQAENATMNVDPQPSLPPHCIDSVALNLTSTLIRGCSPCSDNSEVVSKESIDSLDSSSSDISLPSYDEQDSISPPCFSPILTTFFDCSAILDESTPQVQSSTNYF